MGWAQVLKQGIKHGEHIVGATVRNSKQIAITAATGWAGMKVLSGDGLLKGTTQAVLGDEIYGEAQNRGLTGGINKVLFGKEGVDKSYAENAADMIAGQGTYATARSDVGAVVGEGIGIYEGGKGVVQDAYHGVQGLTSALGQSPSGNLLAGQVIYDGNGNTHVVTEQEVAALQQASPFGSVRGYVNGLTGGKVSGLNMLEIVAAAYMIFGSRFGWLGKIGGALIGGAAAKDITGRAAQQQAQQMQQGLGLATQPVYTEAPQKEDDLTVSRGRRI